MKHIPYILYSRQQATQSMCWSTTMWKGSSTRRTTVRRVGGSAGYISHTIRRQKKVTHFQDAGKRPEKPGEENPWLGFWPKLGERDTDDGQPRLWCNQTCGVSTATVIHFSFKRLFSCSDFCRTHSSWCLSQMFMRSYYVQLFGTFTFLLLATLALFSNKYSAARPEGRISQVALEYHFHYLWFWKHTCVCFFKSKMFKTKKMKIMTFNFRNLVHRYFIWFVIFFVTPPRWSLRVSVKWTFHQAEGECSKNCEVCEKLPIKWVHQDTFYFSWKFKLTCRQFIKWVHFPEYFQFFWEI